MGVLSAQGQLQEAVVFRVLPVSGASIVAYTIFDGTDQAAVLTVRRYGRREL
jgi:hypothetical protein